MSTLHVKDFFKKRIHQGTPLFAKSSLEHCLIYLSHLSIFISPHILFTKKLFTQSYKINTSSKIYFSSHPKAFQSSLTFRPY